MKYKIEMIDGKYHIHILDDQNCMMGKSFHICDTKESAISVIEMEKRNDDVYNINQITNYKG